MRAPLHSGRPMECAVLCGSRWPTESCRPKIPSLLSGASTTSAGRIASSFGVGIETGCTLIAASSEHVVAVTEDEGPQQTLEVHALSGGFPLLYNIELPETDGSVVDMACDD